MTPSVVRAAVVAERVAWVRSMLAGIRALPLGTLQTFESDPRNAAAAESYLRRALEGLLDLGRHILAKAFGTGEVEYKAIASSLARHGVVASAERLTEMAGYRNRMVHFYAELSQRELYEICTGELDDVEAVLDEMLRWLTGHPEHCDRAL